MSKKQNKIGHCTVRCEVIKGVATGKWILDIPAKLMPNGLRKRLFFDNKTRAVDKAKQIKT